MTKQCSKCGEPKALGDFSKNKRLSQGCSSWCKACEKLYHKQHRSKTQKLRRLEDPDKFLDRALQCIYGISLAQYDEMYVTQEGKCLTCHERYPSRGRKRLFVDHDHSTGEIRGLLCYACNTGVGFIEKHPDKFAARLRYLIGSGCDDAIDQIVSCLLKKRTKDVMSSTGA